jgi:hypothetical protein
MRLRPMNGNELGAAAGAATTLLKVCPPVGVVTLLSIGVYQATAWYTDDGEEGDSSASRSPGRKDGDQE